MNLSRSRACAARFVGGNSGGCRRPGRGSTRLSGRGRSSVVSQKSMRVPGQVGRVRRLRARRSRSSTASLLPSICIAPSGYGKSPSRVAEVEVVDAQGLLEPRGVGHLREGDQRRVVVHHQVPPDQARAVTEAVRVPVVAERSSSAAELIAPAATTTTSAEYSSRAPSRSTTTRSTAGRTASVSSRVTWACGEQGDVRVPQRRLDADDLGVGLAVDQAGEAVAGGAADAGGRAPGRASSSRMPLGSGNGCSPARGEIGAQLLDPRLVADRRVRVGRRCRRVGRVGAPLAVHLVELLGPGVPGLEVGVGERPRRRDAVDVLDRAEVPLAHAEQDRPVDLGVAADVVVLLRGEGLAVVVVGPRARSCGSGRRPRPRPGPSSPARGAASRPARAAGSASRWGRARASACRRRRPEPMTMTS